MYTEWGVDVANCDTFTYTATLVGGAALPSFITLDTVSKQFEVMSTDNTKAGTYSIEFKGLNANG